MNIHTGTRPIEVARQSTSCELGNVAFPLMLAGMGERLQVRAIAGHKGQARRLQDLGLRVGKRLKIVNRNASGVVVGIDELRLAISPDAAAKISVTPCRGPKQGKCGKN